MEGSLWVLRPRRWYLGLVFSSRYKCKWSVSSDDTKFRLEISVQSECRTRSTRNLGLIISPSRRQRASMLLRMLLLLPGGTSGGALRKLAFLQQDGDNRSVSVTNAVLSNSGHLREERASGIMGPESIIIDKYDDNAFHPLHSRVYVHGLLSP